MPKLINGQPLSKLKQLLNEKRFVYGVFPSAEKLIGLIQSNKGIISVFYGETYDLYGVTVDSLKYYLFLSLLHNYLKAVGLSVRSTIIIADTASCLNPSVTEKEKTTKEAQKRIKFLHRIITAFNLPCRSVLMSELFRREDIQQKIAEISTIVGKSQKIQQMLEKTVLHNRIKQEYASNFCYSVEAIATASLFDIKIGPPREQFYEQAARAISQQAKPSLISGIYLKPTYPIGLDFSYFLSHPKIEEFGVTPYKAGSNKLQDYRIILGETTISQIKRQIERSFYSRNLNLPNPVMDLYFISQLAKKHLMGDYSLSISMPEVINENQFKSSVFKSIQQYIFYPLGLEEI